MIFANFLCDFQQILIQTNQTEYETTIKYIYFDMISPKSFVFSLFRFVSLRIGVVKFLFTLGVYGIIHKNLLKFQLQSENYKRKLILSNCD